MAKALTKTRGAPVVSWLDRFLIGVAPGWGLRRVRAKTAAGAIARHYDAASAGRRTEGWRRPSTDATAALVPSLSKLRDLSREIRRNNGWARRGVQVIVNNTVGWGITPRTTTSDSAANLAPIAAAAWKAWADSTSCDHDGRLNFYGLQALVMRTIVESGECLIMKETATSADGLAIPIRLRVLEPDFLDTSKDGQIAGSANQIQSGIERDPRGRRVAYWIFDQHPGGTMVPGARFESHRIDAAEVLHVYEVDRAGLMRGAPWLASAIARLNDFDDYEDAILMQQKVAACFGAFVTDMDGANTALGEQSTADPKLENMEPGHIAYLGPGKSVTFATPPNVSNQEIFSISNLRRIAASLGVTYEDLTGDYSKVNFSSARMGRLAHYANVDAWRWQMLIPGFCDGVWRWVMGLAQQINGWPELPGVEWAPPPIAMLEPDKEGLAYTRLIRSGVMTLGQAIRERGGDLDLQLAEMAAINAQLDELEIVLDSDPRKTSTSGQVQVEPTVATDPATAGRVEAGEQTIRERVAVAIEVEVAKQIAEIEQATAGD